MNRKRSEKNPFIAGNWVRGERFFGRFHDPAQRQEPSAQRHGGKESAAADASVDSYALERKVSVTLYIEGAPSLAQNPR